MNSFLNAFFRLFIRDHKSTGDMRVRESYGKLAGIVGIVANLVLFAGKITSGILLGSISVTADAVNNLSDSGSSLVTLFGFKISGKPADAKHPYGHARMENISGLVVSFIIMVLGIQLVQGSIRKIIVPEEMGFGLVPVLILIVSILVKLWLSVFYRETGRMIDSTALAAATADSLGDVLATASALASVLIYRFTGFNPDGYIGTAVSLFILISGVRIALDTVNHLLGMAPSKELVEKCYRKILSYEGIIGLHDLTVHSYGVGKYFASVHCEVPVEQDMMLSHDIIDNIERDFLKDEGIHLVIHLDPVVTNDERTNALKEKVEGLIRAVSPAITMHDFRVVWGKSHSNLIFDIVVPYGLPQSDDELAEIISGEISKLDPTYRTVITVDHSYIPDLD